MPRRPIASASVDRTDVVVIGAGVMGSAAAWALGERSVETILLEQFEFGHARGSSHGPVRIFRLSYPDPVYVGMARRAHEAWRRLEDSANEELLVTTGGLDAGPAAVVCAQALRHLGVPSEWLTPGEAAERFPAISFDDLGDVLFQPDAGVCRADRTVAAQIRVAAERGVEVRDRTRIEWVEADGDGVRVHTAEGTIAARAAVVTAGSWAGPLLKTVGPGLMLTPILQHVSYFGPPEVEIPTLIEWGMPGIVTYATGPAGVAPGVKIGEHWGGTPVDPRDGPFEIDPERVASHVDYAKLRFPTLDPEPLGSETCLYTMTPDEDFVIDRMGPVVVGAGFSGHGFKFGPLIGEILAGLALGEDPGNDLDRFRLDRSAVRAG